MRKNGIVVTIVIMTLMIMNSVLPRYAVCREGYDDLFALIGSQPLLQQFDALTMLPVNIVNRLLAGEGVPAGQSRPDKGNTERANTSADYSLVCGKAGSGGKGILIDSPLFGGGSLSGACGWIVLSWKDVLVSGNSRGGGMLEGMGVLILLMLLLMLLPRGSLSDHNSSMKVRGGNAYRSPIRETGGLGFFIGWAR